MSKEGREGGREGWREGEREGGREGRRAGGRDGGREGGREVTERETERRDVCEGVRILNLAAWERDFAAPLRSRLLIFLRAYIQNRPSVIHQ